MLCTSNNDSTTRTKELTLVVYGSGDIITLIRSDLAQATTKWLRGSSDIPVPSVLYYHVASDMPSSPEFVLTTAPQGKKLKHIYQSFTADQTTRLIDNLVNLVIKTSKTTPNSKISGLQSGVGQEIRPGPLIYANLASSYIIAHRDSGDPDKQSRFPEIIRQGFGPFDTPVDYYTAFINAFVYYIRRGSETEIQPLTQILPRIEKFVSILPSFNEDLNKQIKLQFYNPHLLSMDNIMVDPGSFEITGVLFWDHAGTYPIRPNWTNVPVDSTMNDATVPVSSEFLQLFTNVCAVRGIHVSSEKDMYVGGAASGLQMGLADKVHRLAYAIKLFVHCANTYRRELTVSLAPKRAELKAEIEQLLAEFNV